VTRHGIPRGSEFGPVLKAAVLVLTACFVVGTLGTVVNALGSRDLSIGGVVFLAIGGLWFFWIATEGNDRYFNQR
jgi:hypothetical protein